MIDRSNRPEDSAAYERATGEPDDDRPDLSDLADEMSRDEAARWVRKIRARQEAAR